MDMFHDNAYIIRLGTLSGASVKTFIASIIIGMVTNLYVGVFSFFIAIIVIVYFGNKAKFILNKIYPEFVRRSQNYAADSTLGIKWSTYVSGHHASGNFKNSVLGDIGVERIKSTSIFDLDESLLILFYESILRISGDDIEIYNVITQQHDIFYQSISNINYMNGRLTINPSGASSISCDGIFDAQSVNRLLERVRAMKSIK